MHSELEDGVYQFRIKFTNEKDELEVNYQKHNICKDNPVKEVKTRIEYAYKATKICKGDLHVTYKLMPTEVCNHE